MNIKRVFQTQDAQHWDYCFTVQILTKPDGIYAIFHRLGSRRPSMIKITKEQAENFKNRWNDYDEEEFILL